MSVLLHGNLGKLAALAAKGESARYAVHGVSIAETEGGAYRVEVTDGRRLARVSGRVVGQEHYPDFPALAHAPNGQTRALIPARDLAEAMKAAPKKGGAVLNSVGVVMGENVATLGSTDGSAASVRESQVIDGRYPATDDVFPQGAPALSVHVNPKLLAELLSVAAGFCQDGTARVTLVFHGAAKPFGILAGNREQTFHGLMMPLS